MLIEVALGIFVNFIVGGLWYNPVLFGDLFMKVNNIKSEEVEMNMSHSLATFLFSLLEVIGLFYCVMREGCTNWLQGARVGYLVWQFVVVPSLGVHYVFDGRPIVDMFSKWGHHFFSFVLEAAVIAAYRGYSMGKTF